MSFAAAMKKLLLLQVAIATISASAQTTVTVTTGPGIAQQTWYKLTTDAVTSAALAEWDIAFEINGGFNAGILANTQKGLQVFQSPYSVADWTTLDTTGMAAGWTVLHNSDKDWSLGALNSDVDLDNYNLGWGIYNTVTHVVAGDSIYVVRLTSGDVKKLRIDALSAGTYNFTYANIDGSDEQVHAVAKADYVGKNYTYWSMATNSALDREPAAADWDFVFGKYITDIGQWYGVTGVLQNKGVEVVQVGGTLPADATMDWTAFDTTISAIGYDWKAFDMNIFQYVVDDSLTYFVKDIPGNLWKVIFTGFGGSTTGDITFTKELLSATGVNETTKANTFVIYPNPALDGMVNVVIDATQSTGNLSVIDLSGKIVRQEMLNGLNGLSTRTIDIAGLSAGVYTMQFASNNVSMFSKLIVR